ncbi:MAG: (d)CMP kinase [Parachlamydiales bacterium]|nr:(d)CMP kinase [Parachlamydiales bacterium]
MIITIDGPSGTGKSTIAKLVAKKLGFVFFNTGAMFRAVTYAFINNNLAFQDTESLKECLRHLNYEIKNEDGQEHYILNGEDITDEIRSQIITTHVSEISAMDFVRSELLQWQQKLAQNMNAVFEGRDMGTVVFPDADMKVFLTASAQVRATRRYLELIGKNDFEMSQEQILQDIIRRDAYDSSRAIAPLKKADDAFLLDCTNLNIEQVVEVIIQQWYQKRL